MGSRMRDRHSVEALQWLAYIVQTRNDVIHAGNGRAVHLPGVPNVNVDGYSPKTRGFWVFGLFWDGCPCMPNRHKPIGTTEKILLTRYEETKARLQKLKMQVIQWFRSGRCKFKKPLREDSGLENKLNSHPYLNTPLNIRGALYGGRIEATKTYFTVKLGG